MSLNQIIGKSLEDIAPWSDLTINSINVKNPISKKELLYPRIEISGPTYNALETDYIISVDTSSSSCNINLPLISSEEVGSSSFVILDNTGNAFNNHITISPHITDTILGSSELIINNDFNSVTLYSSPTSKNWSL
jgi:hypothetical protein